MDRARAVETRLEEMKRYVRFSDDDAVCIADLRERVAPHFSRIADEHYARIREHDDAYSVLRGEAQVARLAQAFRVWLDRLFSGRYDEAYYEQTVGIGRIHARIGLPVRYLVASFSVVRSSLLALVDDDAARGSLMRLLDVELAILVESFHADVATRLESVVAARQDHRRARLVAVGNLASGLAHEIRNPLNGALLHVAYLERALRRDEAPAETREALQVVEREIKRLARLVTEFLEFAKPQPLRPTGLALRGLCARIVERGATVSDDRVAVSLDFPDEDIVIEADGERLAVVLGNLMENAIDALTASGGTVVLRVRRASGSQVWIDVEDDGPGFSAEAPLFDPFYSTKAAGTGLGLSIAHRVVTDHGGSIDVESQPGRTRFRVVLPVKHERRIGTDE